MSLKEIVAAGEKLPIECLQATLTEIGRPTESKDKAKLSRLLADETLSIGIEDVIEALPPALIMSVCENKNLVSFNGLAKEKRLLEVEMKKNLMEFLNSLPDVLFARIATEVGADGEGSTSRPQNTVFVIEEIILRGMEALLYFLPKKLLHDIFLRLVPKKKGEALQTDSKKMIERIIVNVFNLEDESETATSLRQQMEALAVEDKENDRFLTNTPVSYSKAKQLSSAGPFQCKTSLVNKTGNRAPMSIKAPPFPAIVNKMPTTKEEETSTQTTAKTVTARKNSLMSAFTFVPFPSFQAKENVPEVETQPATAIKQDYQVEAQVTSAETDAQAQPTVTPTTPNGIRSYFSFNLFGKTPLTPGKVEVPAPAPIVEPVAAEAVVDAEPVTVAPTPAPVQEEKVDISMAVEEEEEEAKEEEKTEDEEPKEAEPTTPSRGISAIKRLSGTFASLNIVAMARDMWRKSLDGKQGEEAETSDDDDDEEEEPEAKEETAVSQEPEEVVVAAPVREEIVSAPMKEEVMETVCPKTEQAETAMEEVKDEVMQTKAPKIDVDVQALALAQIHKKFENLRRLSQLQSPAKVTLPTFSASTTTPTAVQTNTRSSVFASPLPSTTLFSFSAKKPVFFTPQQEEEEEKEEEQVAVPEPEPVQTNDVKMDNDVPDRIPDEEAEPETVAQEVEEAPVAPVKPSTQKEQKEIQPPKEEKIESEEEQEEEEVEVVKKVTKTTRGRKAKAATTRRASSKASAKSKAAAKKKKVEEEEEENSEEEREAEKEREEKAKAERVKAKEEKERKERKEREEKIRAKEEKERREQEEREREEQEREEREREEKKKPVKKSSRPSAPTYKEDSDEEEEESSSNKTVEEICASGAPQLAELMEFKVVDLRVYMKAHALSQAGKKEMLCKRIISYLKDEKPATTTTTKKSSSRRH